MNSQTIDNKTKDGVVSYHFFGPLHTGNQPAVIFYMDAIGIRPALRDMAARLASNGFHVLLASKMCAAVYVGVAGIDPHFTPEEKQRLESALQSAGVEHTIEVYPDIKHSFSVNDTPVYDRAASERHWQQILKLFAGKPS